MTSVWKAASEGFPSGLPSGKLTSKNTRWPHGLGNFAKQGNARGLNAFRLKVVSNTAYRPRAVGTNRHNKGCINTIGLQ